MEQLNAILKIQINRSIYSLGTYSADYALISNVMLR